MPRSAILTRTFQSCKGETCIGKEQHSASLYSSPFGSTNVSAPVLVSPPTCDCRKAVMTESGSCSSSKILLGCKSNWFEEFLTLEYLYEQCGRSDGDNPVR